MTNERVQFRWDGDPVEGRRGEPIASALWRAGVQVQTRSIKYHRARGPHCMTGDCPGCMVRVEGVPNVRGCKRPVEEGIEVESQVGMPSAEHDVFALVDRVFDHFDHERRFVKPVPVRMVYQALARRMAGFGTQPTGELPVRKGKQLAVDVLVAGGGPAGLAASHAAIEQGASTLVVDDAGFGGQLRYTNRPIETPGFDDEAPRIAEALIPDASARKEGAVFGIWEDRAAILETGREGFAVHTVHPETIVIATGASENPCLVDGNDRPGVFGARAARILLNRWNTPPGDTIVVHDPRRQGYWFLESAREHGLDVERVDEIDRILGDPSVTGVETPSGEMDASSVVVDEGLTPAPELGRQAGIPYTYEASLGGRVPLHRPDGSTPLSDVFVAGSAAGLHTPEAALVSGRRAGLNAAGAAPSRDPESLLSRTALLKPEKEALRRLWARP